MRPECEKLRGKRKQSICNGEADLSLDKINAYRFRWGFEPLSKEVIQQEVVQSIKTRIKKIKSKRVIKPRSKGPGSELSNLLGSLGIKPKANCSCNLLISTMDSLGPAGCRQNKEKLLGLMRENQDKYGWGTYLRAGFNAVRTGWVFKLNPLDPLPQLFDEAIRLAEQQ